MVVEKSPFYTVDIVWLRDLLQFLGKCIHLR